MRIMIIFMTLILASCAVTGSAYKGARVEQEEIIPLPAGPSELTWQDLYMKVDYSLARQGEQLRIEGTLSFSANPRMDQAWADDVTLSLYLLDDQGVVQSYSELAHTLGSRLDGSIPFRKVLPLTNEMTAIWFGYEGKFRGQKEDGDLYVWKRPKRSS